MLLQELRPPPAPSRLVCDSTSLPSYKDYPAHRPFINTLVHRTPQTRTLYRPASPSKAFPETSSAGKLICLSVRCQIFHSNSVPELHGYTCNAMPHYLNVSAAQASFHPVTHSPYLLVFISSTGLIPSLNPTRVVFLCLARSLLCPCSDPVRFEEPPREDQEVGVGE